MPLKKILSYENGKLDLSSKVFLILFIPASIYLLLILYLSFFWRVQLDHAMTFYVAFLADVYHKLPYKEIFDMNLPGTYLIHIIIGKIFGYSDLGIRFADVCILIGISSFTFAFLKRYGYKSATSFVVIFVILYLTKRPYTIMQREYFIVAILSVILFLNFRFSTDRKNIILLTGFLTGICATIKPHALIIIPAFILYKFIEAKFIDKRENIFKYLFAYALNLSLGAIIPIAIMFAWLVWSGTMNSFIDMVRYYFPLYADLNNTHYVVTGFQRYSYIMNEFFKFNEKPLFLVTAVIGAYFCLFRFELKKEQRKQILLLCVLMAAFAVYTTLSGQYWPHHWLPCMYIVSILTSLCFIHSDKIFKREKYFVMFFLFAAGLSLFIPYKGFISQLKGGDVDVEQKQRVMEISDYVIKNAGPADDVQLLDWMGGTGEAMLRARKDHPNKFVYDFYFYHHVSNPYIQSLKKEFIADLMTRKPKFIIKILDKRPIPRGFDTSENFPEMDKYIEENYNIDVKGDGYLIFKKK